MSTRNLISPCLSKLKARESSQSVDSNRRNPNLVDHLLISEGLSRHSVIFEGSPKFLKRPDHLAEFSGELFTHTSRSFE